MVEKPNDAVDAEDVNNDNGVRSELRGFVTVVAKYDISLCGVVVGVDNVYVAESSDE